MSRIKPYLDDILYWLGAFLLAGFSWFVYKPLPLLVLGAFCLLFAFLIAQNAARERAK
jgi:mannose/fructose/N-acetylgalactosamine-specific phosphotransferase system component IIC